jgi:hypothetical protein
MSNIMIIALKICKSVKSRSADTILSAMNDVMRGETNDEIAANANTHPICVPEK